MDNLISQERVKNPPPSIGKVEYFTGRVWLEEIIKTPAATGINIYRVTFEPGARTAWHTHPKGQILHIEKGVCRFQRVGESVVEMHPGETVYIAPNERHWHGAAPNSLMTHLAVQPAAADESDVYWEEKVSDAEYEKY
jgi:quercetin dioxygenase-like cupin family protein